jgi:hypothetical protein
VIYAGQNRSLAGVSSGGSGDVADLVSNPKLSNPTIGKWFNTLAFQPPPLGSFGNAGRGCVYGPGFWNADLALLRNFSLPLGEGSKAQFRAEFYNALNHVNPSNPTTNLSSGTFGTISGYRGPRLIEFGLKVMF